MGARAKYAPSMPSRSYVLAFSFLPLLACQSRKLEEAQRAQAGVEIGMLTAAAELSFVVKGACPASLEQLKADAQLSPASKTTDPWGTPYSLRCDPVRITSFGPDKKEGTADDVVKKKKDATK